MKYDLVIIGAGWAGFNAAIEAKKLGLKVALVEKSDIGGTCLNKGCIPTKSLIQSARVFESAKRSKNFGITMSGECVVDLQLMQERKIRLVDGLKKSMESSLKEVDFFYSQAEIIDPETIILSGNEIKTKSMLIATGSVPIEIKGLEFDGKKVISSDEILNLRDLPKSLLIIGAGVIGCEFASLFSSLGTSVTIVELCQQLLPGLDAEVAKKLQTSFMKRKIKINLGADAKDFKRDDFDLVLVAVGRRPQLAGLNQLGLRLDGSAIAVNDYLKTSVDRVFAAGDCTGKVLLAHYACYQGKIAAYNIACPDKMIKADSKLIPSCIFTTPEIASIGLTEEEAKAKGFRVIIKRFDFLGCGMARILDETEGFIKVLSDEDSGRILGSSIIGPKATELVSFFTLAISAGVTASQIRDLIFAHPTVSESISEVFAQADS